MTHKSFDDCFRLVKVGMSQATVEQLLGKPDDIWTPDDHSGTWVVGVSEVWIYGTLSHKAYATKGSVYFDQASKVQVVYDSSGHEINAK